MQLAFVATDKIGLEVEPFSSHFLKGEMALLSACSKAIQEAGRRRKKKKNRLTPSPTSRKKNGMPFFPLLIREIERGKWKKIAPF